MRRILTILALLLLGLAAPGWAADVFVDGDTACPGAGTTGTPYCSIQNAFNAVSPGDVIKLRETAATPDYNEQATLTTSGTAGNPITIQPDTGHSPTIINTALTDNGALEFPDVSHILVQNLTFDGSSANTSAFALKFRAPSANTDGNQVIGNTFLNWGAAAATHSTAADVVFLTNPNLSPKVVHDNVVVRNNTFDGGRHHGVLLRRVRNGLIEQNTVQHLRCGDQGGGFVGIEGIKFGNDGTTDIIYTSNNIVRDNVLRNFNPGECASPGVATYPIWTDRGVEAGTVERNLIFNTPGPGAGIHIEARCDNWVVKNNLVYDGPDEAARNREADGTRWYNNTFVGIATGARIQDSGNTTWTNNIVQATSVNWLLQQGAINEGGHVFATNLYDNVGGTGTFQWGGSPTETFPEWQAACNCDGNSALGDPLFVDPLTDDYHLQAGSPAVDAGTNLVGVVDDDFDGDPRSTPWDIGMDELGGGGDTLPDAFAFTDLTGQTTATLVASDSVQITGMDAGTSISISATNDEQYRICGDSACTVVNHAYTSVAGSIDPGEWVQLRMTSSTGTNVTRNATLTIGAGEDTWSVTTAGELSIPATLQAEDYDGGTGTVAEDCTAITSGPYCDTTAGDASGDNPRGDDVDIKTVAGEGLTVAWTVAGEWLSYAITAATTQTFNCTARMANGSGQDRSFHLELDTVDVTGAIVAPQTGSWNTQQTVSCGSFQVASGTHVLEVHFDDAPMDLNWVALTTTDIGLSFEDVAQKLPNTVIASDIIQITPATGTAISLAESCVSTCGAQYRICADGTCSLDPAWTADAGTVDTGDWVQLRLTSATGAGQTNSAILTVGSESDQWDVQTTLNVAGLRGTLAGGSFP